jgi:hypothetical protein
MTATHPPSKDNINLSLVIFPVSSIVETVFNAPEQPALQGRTPDSAAASEGDFTPIGSCPKNHLLPIRK